MINVNKIGADWVAIKAWLNHKIEQARSDMEAGQTMEEYHNLRGQILMAKLLIEEVEPSTPPQTSEDNYGFSAAD